MNSKQSDIRWQQRFSNYKRALSQLSKFMKHSHLNELEEQGLIQAFEYTHELAWKTLADYAKDKGYSDIYGSKDATRQAFNMTIIENGDVWMEMIQSRNLTSHTYNQDVTKQIIDAIHKRYYLAFVQLETRLEKLKT
ncbi:MAG TPA: nucleotidyltransferase substrate binding protein [Chlamydiales bacterium]|nr:nucleotidyltransferase substrate binding protein [Chlamydiales bacterium]